MSYAAELRAAFSARADPEVALGMAKYMRDQFPFFGLRKPVRAEAQKVFFAERGPPDLDELTPAVRELWGYPERECQYAALHILERYVKPKRTPLEPAVMLPLFEHLVTHKSWWDTVDWIAAKLVGWALRDDLVLRGDAVARWRRSDDLWLRRTAILFQLNYKGRTDAELLFSLCTEHAADSEFFIRKAIGWALREYAKTDADAVATYVAQHPELSGLSQREALKHLGKT